MNVLIAITIALIASFILSELFYRLKWPTVIAQILAGILLGLPFIKDFLFSESSNVMKFLADLGIIFLMFLAGLEIDRNKLYKVKKDSTIIAVFAFFTTFFLCLVVLKLLGYPTMISLIVSVCLSITSEGTAASVLMEIRKLDSKIGTRLIGAGIIDDVIGLFMFILISLMVGSHLISTNLYSPFHLAGFVLVMWLIFKLLPFLIKFEERETKDIREVSLFTTVLLMCLVFTVFGQVISGTLTGGVIAAFLTGVAVQFSMTKKEEHIIRSHFKTMTLAFVVPSFFIGIGLDFDLTVFKEWPLLILLFFVGNIGKIIGTIFSTPITNLRPEQSLLLGWGMTSRGGIELAIALLALRLGVITPVLYSAIIGTSFITTFIFPFVFRYIVSKNHKIME